MTTVFSTGNKVLYFSFEKRRTIDPGPNTRASPVHCCTGERENANEFFTLTLALVFPQHQQQQQLTLMLALAQAHVPGESGQTHGERQG